MVASCVVAVPLAAVGAMGIPVNSGLIFWACTYAAVASSTQIFAELYEYSTSVLLLYQSCPKIGVVGAVELAKFSSKYTKFSFSAVP